jgi:hypothetical protein
MFATKVTMMPSSPKAATPSSRVVSNTISALITWLANR